MGMLNLFSKSAPTLMGLPSGSFTLDRDGSMLVSTLPSSFPADLVADIGREVLEVFRDAAGRDLGDLLVPVVVGKPRVVEFSHDWQGRTAIPFHVEASQANGLTGRTAAAELRRPRAWLAAQPRWRDSVG